MTKVEWWLAKIYPGRNRQIDLWDLCKSQKDAEARLKADGPDSPFNIVKVTMEIIVRKKRKSTGRG